MRLINCKSCGSEIPEARIDMLLGAASCARCGSVTAFEPRVYRKALGNAPGWVQESTSGGVVTLHWRSLDAWLGPYGLSQSHASMALWIGAGIGVIKALPGVLGSSILSLLWIGILAYIVWWLLTEHRLEVSKEGLVFASGKHRVTVPAQELNQLFIRERVKGRGRNSIRSYVLCGRKGVLETELLPAVPSAELAHYIEARVEELWGVADAIVPGEMRA